MVELLLIKKKEGEIKFKNMMLVQSKQLLLAFHFPYSSTLFMIN